MKKNGIVKLGLWMLGLWFFFAVLTPRLEALIPAWRQYNMLQEESGLNSGAVYYTDVPVTQESEQHMRAAVQKGMNQRRARQRPQMSREEQ